MGRACSRSLIDATVTWSTTTPQRGLRLDPVDYQIGAGTGLLVETDFADARLEVSDDGAHAAALFTDADGRRIEVRVDDRDGRRRRRGGLLAAVGAAIAKPTSLSLVWRPRVRSVRTGGGNRSYASTTST
jgi:hypothetical protein